MNLIKIKKANQTPLAWIKFQPKGQTFYAWNDAWHKCLSKVQGSKDAKRASRISNTVNELRTQLTPQFAKSASSASGSARTQAGATHAPGGFTIAELLIATSIFSVVLLVGAAAVTQLGRSYYKGVTVTQTQQAAKQIMQNVSSNIRLSSTVSPINSASDDRKYYCVGGHRYSFKLFNMVNTADHDNSTKFGLIADEPSGDGCGNPFDGSAPLVKPAELLGNNMRLLAFSITAVGSSTTTYSVNVTVA
ncbi:type II secretion system protein, partial [Candidatus Saccharibacteria bacterium]|nr:type II secretion system protein [Candidatus Saccharibacteria bacterium]